MPCARPRYAATTATPGIGGMHMPGMMKVQRPNMPPGTWKLRLPLPGNGRHNSKTEQKSYAQNPSHCEYFSFAFFQSIIILSHAHILL